MTQVCNLCPHCPVFPHPTLTGEARCQVYSNPDLLAFPNSALSKQALEEPIHKKNILCSHKIARTEIGSPFRTLAIGQTEIRSPFCTPAIG